MRFGVGELLCFLGALVAVAQGFASVADCMSRFQRCRDRNNQPLTFGQNIPLGNTLSTFLEQVDIMETKLTNNQSTIKASQMAHMLLDWFACGSSGLSNEDDVGNFDNRVEMIRDVLISNVFNDFNRQYNYRYENDASKSFSDDTLCYMANVMSHEFFINRTQSPSAPIQPTARERGVLSIGGLREEALSIVPVLLGIAATDESINVASLDKFGGVYSRDNDIAVRPVTFVTLGAELGYGQVKSFANESYPEIGGRLDERKYISGHWNNTGCMISFLLESVTGNRLSRAKITGAIDGFILGQALARNPSYRLFSLGKLLRFYYSDSKAQLGNVAFSVCNRGDGLGGFSNAYDEIKDQTAAFIYAMSRDRFLPVAQYAPYPKGHTVFKTDAETSWNEMSTQLQQYIDNSLRTTVCKTYGTTSQDVCATPMHLFLVLDTSAEVVNDNKTNMLQRKIVGGIMNHFRWAPSVTMVSLFASARGSTGLYSLLDKFETAGGSFRERIRSITSSGCPGCYVEFLDRVLASRNMAADDSQVFQALNQTLMTYKQDPTIQRSSGTPSRVVVLLRMRTKGFNSDNQVHDALMTLSYSHPEVNFIGVGERTLMERINGKTGTLNIVDLIKLDRESDQREIEESSEFKRLTRLMCRTPMQLQNERCWPWVNDQSIPILYEGGILPGQMQLVSYNSYYFSASKDLQIEFEAGPYGELKVCDITTVTLDPNRAISSVDFQGCQSTTDNTNSNSNSRLLTFYYRYPCSNGPRFCPSKVFAVLGSLKQTNIGTDYKCLAPTCPNVAAISYNVQPKGMVCGSILTAATSPTTLLIALVASIAWFKSWVN